MDDHERVSCVECGASILPATAERNDGKCAPCKGGFKVDIEAGRERRRKEKEIRNSPQGRYWHDLATRVYSEEVGFASLRESEQLYFAIVLLDGEVYNGGFDQYFFNSSGDYFDYAIKGLTEIKAVTSLRLLQEAKIASFGNETFIADIDERRRLLISRMESEADAEVQAKLNQLDDAYYEDPDDLAKKLDDFGLEHGLWKN